MTPPARVLALVGGLATAVSPAPGQGLPSGGVTECAIIDYEGNHVIVTQLTPDCVINWETFEIAFGNLVDFQQDGSWRILNRVTGDAFSLIAGVMRADGTVMIVNPAGIYFDGTAVVDVGALYAAAGSISDEDFLAGDDRFTGLASEVVNEGTIFGQAVHLMGRRVANHGSITATGGFVTIVAGADEVFIGERDGHRFVRVDGVTLSEHLHASGGVVPVSEQAAVTNTGSIDAIGGQVVLGAGDLFSLAIRNTGSINGLGGTVQLAATGGSVEHGPGGTIAAGELFMSGDRIVLESDVDADAARFNDPVLLAADVHIAGQLPGAEADAVVFADTVDGASFDLDIDAVETRFEGDVGATARLRSLEVSGHATARGDILTTAGVTFGGGAAFAGTGDQLVDAGGGAMVAGDDLIKSTGGDLTFRGAGGISIDGDARVDAAAGSLVLDDDALITGSAVSIGGDVRFNDEARLDGDVRAGNNARFDDDAEIDGSVIAGNEVSFDRAATVGGDIESGDDLTIAGAAVIGGSVSAGRDADFLGSTRIEGDVTAGDDLTVIGALTAGGSVTALDDASLIGPVTVGGDLSAGDDLLVFSTATIGGDVMTADDLSFFADARIGGSVTAGDDAEFFGAAFIGGAVTAVDDVQFFADAEIRGDITSGDDVEFSGGAIVGGDVTAADAIRFERGAILNGAAGQHLSAGGALVTQGALVKTTGGVMALDGQTIALHGGLVEAQGDILLNAEGRADVPELATIFARQDLVIRASGGDVVMGPNEKLTVLGDLLVEGLRVTLGDVNTLDDMSIQAQEIFLRTRDPGPVLGDDGGVLFDRGVDYVAGGRFLFSVVPVILGGGPAPRFASAILDPDALGTLLGFRLQVFAPFSQGLFRSEGRFLDLVGIGPTAVGIAEVYASELPVPKRPAPVRRGTAETLIAELAALGIDVRPPGADEVAAGREGPVVFDDLPGAAVETRPAIASARLDGELVQTVLATYRRLSAPERSEAFGAAWDAYAATAPGKPTGSGFREFLAEHPGHAEAAGALADLDALLDQLERAGATPGAVDAARRRIVRAVAGRPISIADWMR